MAQPGRFPHREARLRPFPAPPRSSLKSAQIALRGAHWRARAVRSCNYEQGRAGYPNPPHVERFHAHEYLPGEGEERASRRLAEPYRGLDRRARSGRAAATSGRGRCGAPTPPPCARPTARRVWRVCSQLPPQPGLVGTLGLKLGERPLEARLKARRPPTADALAQLAAVHGHDQEHVQKTKKDCDHGIGCLTEPRLPRQRRHGQDRGVATFRRAERPASLPRSPR
jgi:hypothetical protein